jgi:repressor LexA
MTARLTRRQAEILGFIESEITRRGIPPTVREIAARFSIASPNAVKCHLDALRDKGCISVERGVSRGIRLAARAGMHGYPLAGEVAAGGPRLAVQAEGESMTLDEAAGARPGDFLLTVKGDSMVGAGINPGDLAVVRPGPEVANGEIAVVMLGAEEATLKRFFKGPGGKLRLVPENPEYADIVVDPASMEFRIVGRVVGVVRRY